MQRVPLTSLSTNHKNRGDGEGNQKDLAECRGALDLWEGRFLKPFITKAPSHLSHREAGERASGPTWQLHAHWLRDQGVVIAVF